jgi:hypothetical protein
MGIRVRLTFLLIGLFAAILAYNAQGTLWTLPIAITMFICLGLALLFPEKKAG